MCGCVRPLCVYMCVCVCVRARIGICTIVFPKQRVSIRPALTLGGLRVYHTNIQRASSISGIQRYEDRFAAGATGLSITCILCHAIRQALLPPPLVCKISLLRKSQKKTSAGIIRLAWRYQALRRPVLELDFRHSE